MVAKMCACQKLLYNMVGENIIQNLITNPTPRPLPPPIVV